MSEAVPPPPPPALPPTPPAAAPQPQAAPVATAAPTGPVSLASSLALLKPLLAMVALLTLMFAGVVAGGRWLLMNEDGARWVINRLPGVQATGWRGALLDSQWSAQTLRVRWDDGQQWLLIEDLRATGVAAVLRPHAQAWLGLAVDTLQAGRVTLHTGPRGPRPIPLPETLAWPLQVNVRQATMAELRVDELSPFAALTVQGLALDPRPQARHAFLQAQAQWQGLQLSAQGGIGHQRPFVVDVQGTVQPLFPPGPSAATSINSEAAAPAWAAALRTSGALAHLQLQGTLRSVPLAGANAAGAPAAAPAVDLSASLRVLEDWPLHTLQLKTENLNLKALQTTAPRTALSGTVNLAMQAQNAPINAQVDLRNTQAGRWDSGLVPLRQVRGVVVGSLAQRQRLDFNQLELQFGDAAGPAGTWTGSATWQGHELKLQTQLQDLAPQRLDSRAAAMRLSGPFNATLLGLPSPDTSAKGAASKPPPPQLTWDFDLQGLLERAPQPVQLATSGVASEGRLEVKRAQARTGNASAEFTGTLLCVTTNSARKPAAVRSAGGPAAAGQAPNAKSEWQVQTQGQVKDFDPLPWWPGERNTVWHKGPHRLTAQWTLALQLPPGAAQLPAAELVQRLAGNGTVLVKDSLLAGLPLTADITLSHAPGTSNTPATVKADIRAAGNVLTLDGRGDPLGEGLNDRWRAELKAEQLTALAPWAALHPALADWMPQQGRVNATLTSEGRWPQLRTEGSARATQLRVGAYQLQTGQADWRLDTASTGPLDLKLDLGGLQAVSAPAAGAAAQPTAAAPASPPGPATQPPGFSVDRLRADVRGTVQNHQISLTASLPAGLSPMLVKVLGLRTETGTQGTQGSLQAQGSWQAEAGGAGQWRGTVDRLLVSAWDGKATDALPAATWAEARNLKAQLQVGAGGTLHSLQADAGRLLVGPPGAAPLALKWDDVQVDLRPDTPHLRLRAELEPFDAVPLLARLQPTMGWSGNLKLGARLDLRALERMDADLVLQRTDGDLNIENNDGLQLLGLTDLRLTLAAHDGLWQLSPLVRGRGVGEVTGAMQLRTTPERRWPGLDAPLQGSVTARAPDIGIWAPWVPAGWRLTGEMNATASLGGTLGAPRYTGAVRGNNIGVRNLLQGVNVSNGDVSILLEGETARIERFTLKGGEGRIDITGNANWANAPVARLQLQAQRFRALGRLDRLLIASGEATLNLQRDAARLEGRFKVDEGLFDTTAADAPSLDSDVTIRGQVDETLNAARAEPAPRRRNFALAVDVNMGEKLRVRGRGLDSTLAGSVRITTPDGRLAVNGAIRSVDGTYAAYGQKLEIERGVLTFTGPADNPRLDVLALRPNIDTRVGVLIAGQAQAPRVRLYAEPDMSETDKLSWLVLGRAPDGLGRSDTALLQRAAVALLSGEGEAPTDALLKSLGIDEISLRQGDGEVRETVITLGKQLSRRWYVGYERGVNAASGTWQLIYRIAQRFTLRAQSGLENSLDVIWVWRTQETPADAGMRKSVVTPK